MKDGLHFIYPFHIESLPLVCQREQREGKLQSALVRPSHTPTHTHVEDTGQTLVDGAMLFCDQQSLDGR